MGSVKGDEDSYDKILPQKVQKQKKIVEMFQEDDNVKIAKRVAQ